ncbi:MAG: hypothetical protein ACXW1S_05390 [Acidimicrobiia bacterium]
MAGPVDRDATWSALTEFFDPPALVEILFVVGQYTMQSMVPNAAAVGIAEDLEELPIRE